MAKPTEKTYTPEKQTLRLNERLLPDLKNIDVGQTADITVKVKMISKTQGSEYSIWGGSDDGNESQAYKDAESKDQNQLKGTFEILEAADDDVEDAKEPAKSAEQMAADKIMKRKKMGRVV